MEATVTSASAMNEIYRKECQIGVKKLKSLEGCDATFTHKDVFLTPF